MTHEYNEIGNIKNCWLVAGVFFRFFLICSFFNTTKSLCPYRHTHRIRTAQAMLIVQWLMCGVRCTMCVCMCVVTNDIGFGLDQTD